MKKLRSIISFALVFFIFFGIAPQITPAHAAQVETYSLANGNIEVVVSAKNGGFMIRTREGDVFNKDDNNKNLLFHNGEYDTSFTSFEVTEGTKVREYIFGGNYTFLGLGENTLSVTKDNNSITSTWSVDDLTFTQLIQPVWNDSANEHGTIAIYYTVQNAGDTAVDVKARLLLDTSLGDQDYGYYELVKDDGGYEEIVREAVVQGEDIPANFFAYDSLANPSITAFTINDTASEGIKPYKAAFGHWNNLAATVFEFDPDSDLTFTNKFNKKYLTADSAYALYYNLGHVPANSAEAASFLTYYGVYSNIDAKKGDKFSVNITAPSNLELNGGKDTYIGSSGEADGEFTVTTNISNIIQEGAADYDKLAVAVYVDEGFQPLDANGQPAGANFNNPYRLGIDNFKVGEIKQLDWGFDAEVFAAPGYRKISFKVYSMPESANDMLLLENVIGSASTYVLCPGGNGKLPEILFTGASPEMLYFEGTRHFYLSGSGFDMLRDTSRYSLRAYPGEDTTSAPELSYTIPGESIIFTTDDDGNTIIDVVMTEEMELGEYSLVFEWAYGQNPAGIPEKLTAPALKYVVTDDKSYKNDYYGIVVIVKEEPQNGKWEYHIKTFPGEAQFKAFKEDESFEGEVLIELRGEFTVQRDSNGNATSCSATSLYESSDPININGVLDLTEGDLMVALSQSGSKKFVMIDMEGKLLTSYSRTPVWSGLAYLTPLEYGIDCGLVAYDRRGNKLEKEAEYLFDREIRLVWDADYKILQTIAGMVVHMRYGTFGRMYDRGGLDQEAGENDAPELGYVLSFGASLDISKLMPKGKDDKSSSELLPIEVTHERKFGDERNAEKYLKDYNKSKKQADDENKANKTKPVGKVNIEDILYGLNKGLLGINAEAEITLPKYTEALPELGGRLAINTINGYNFEVEGNVSSETFDMEFELRVIGASDGSPVPDKIYFHISGFEPGVNLDGAGVFWLTGGGGGIDKLYETVFGSGLPPLTLLLTADFDVMKVMEARCDLSLSLRGFRIKLSDVKLKGTKMVVIHRGELGVEWYPDFYLLIAASMNILSILEGSCYLVVDNDFVEFFLRVGIKLPKAVPIVGGMVLVKVDLGASSDRVWGVLNIIGLKLGIVYYWGGDFSFGTQKQTIEPTFPELLGLEDIPVGYNTETGQTLYMKVGTNLSPAARAQVVDDLDSTGLVLMGTAPSVRSDGLKTTHKLDLGIDNGNDFAFSIEFPADGPKTIAEAQAAVTVTRPAAAGGTPYTLNFFDISANGGTGNAGDPNVNANLVFDETTGKSSVSISITDYTAGEWNISTSSAADIVLFTVAPLPEVNSFTAVKDGGELDLTWTGSKLDETKMSFYVTNNIGDGQDIGEMGTLIGSMDTSGATGGSITLPLPSDLKNGTYYVRMTMSKEEEVNDLCLAGSGGGSDFTFEWTNVNQPDQPDNVVIENAGNLMFDVDVADDQDSARYDGYLVNVYEENRGDLILTDLTGLSFAKESEISIGGTYTDTNGTPYGLTAGKDYVVGVTAYKNIDPGSDDEVMVTGVEKRSAPLNLRQPTPPVVSFRADAPHNTLDRTVTISGTQSNLVSIDTFTTNDVEFTLLPDQAVADGRWYIDDMTPVEVAGISVDGLNIGQYLPDGDHTVTFTGRNSQGDGFTYSRIFSVDTTPPRLMLTSPTNGSFFSEDGNLKIAGITDTNAMFTVKVDGQTRIEKDTLEDMDQTIGADGTFSFDLALNPGEASHRIEITVEDKAGNSASSSTKVWNSGLSGISELDILIDGVEYSGSNIVLDKGGETTGLFSLQATTNKGKKYIIDDGSLVTWEVIAREGSAHIDSNGVFTASPGSAGLAAAYFHVADGADMTAAVSFGAERFNPPTEGSYRLTMANTLGGTVTGAGNYMSGAQVSITAKPGSGYRFSGWSSSNGGSFADASSASTTFTMPPNDTIVTARFTHIASGGNDNNSGGDTKPITPTPAIPLITPTPVIPPITKVNAEKGQLVLVTLTTGQLKEGDYLVPCYILYGKKYIVAGSSIVDGRLIFIAPVSAEFCLEVNKPVFPDISGHWASEYIGFTAARALFRGVGDGRFDPGGQMTRAMFVTVLARLDGVDLSAYRNTRFRDVTAGSWYEGAVEWALENKIISGTGETTFAPDDPVTREQMALIMYNYARYKGYNIGTSGAASDPFLDSGSVSLWAEKAVKWIQNSGIMNGKPGNMFDPSGIASRAEGCAVFTRLIKAILQLNSFS